MGRDFKPTGMATDLQQIWSNRGVIAHLLLPVMAVYRVLFAARRFLYWVGLQRTRRVGIPVVVVGSVMVGGTGKTPTTIGVVRHLKERGLSVGVVSRGYGRREDGCRAVTDQSTPEDVGDEPLLIHRATNAPVMVASNRFEAATSLLTQHPGLDVLVCDDGLQHLGLYRDVEICVFDDRGLGNGWLLPAGPLRESWPREMLAGVGQSAATTIVLNTGKSPGIPGYAATRTLDAYAIARDGSRRPLSGQALGNAKPFYAVAGIAQPAAFFEMLRGQNIKLAGELGLADHDDFARLDPAILRKYTLLCTEKDAIKLWKLAPDALAVPLHQAIEPAFFEALDRLLAPQLRAKLSSPNG
jgi:tetraacyldisaccharide 4'-kinase